MNDNKLIATASEGIKQVAIRIFSGLVAFSQGRQDRQSLSADVAAVEKLQESGMSIARYSGLSMDVEAFNRAREEEDERRATNVFNALQQADSVVDWEKVDLSKFNPEFAYRWGSEASNVSDETLQNLWARLLKGELESPGSVSSDTMTIARDMTKARAEEFQILCSAAFYRDDGTPFMVFSCGDPGQNSLEDYGLSFVVLMRLVHHRLIVGELNTHITIPNEFLGLSLPLRHGGLGWAIQSSMPPEQSPEGRPINGILFTPAGEELSRVVERIPVPNYTAAMLEYMKEQNWDMLPLP